MKRTKKCPKCDSLRIGYVDTQIDLDERAFRFEGGAATRGKPPDRVVGHGKPLSTGAFAGASPLVGVLEAYVCTECGYHESYVKEPRTIDWVGIVGFTWVNPGAPSNGPFR